MALNLHCYCTKALRRRFLLIFMPKDKIKIEVRVRAKVNLHYLAQSAAIVALSAGTLLE